MPRCAPSVFVLAASLTFATLTGCVVPVAAGLEELDANRVVVALDHVGIEASKETDPAAEGRFRVNVSRDDASRALTTMADEQLPRTKIRGLLEAADRGQLVPSQAAEHAQLVAGLAGELERTLGSIDGVLAARVHMNLPVRDSLRDGLPPKGTASVLVEHRGSASPLAPEAIQRLVAASAPGLAAPDVAVVFVPRAVRQSGPSDVAHVGPIAVARGSAALLKFAFVTLALAVLALAGVTLGLYAKLARLRRGELLAERAPAGPSS